MKPLDTEEVLLLTATRERACALADMNHRLAEFRASPSRYRGLDATLTVILMLPFAYALVAWVAELAGAR